MLTRIRNAWRQLGGQARPAPRPVLPNLSGAELAKSSWATLIASYADVPDAYKSFFEAVFIKGRAFPYTVLTPSHERFLHRQAEKLICAFDDEIAVLERTGNTFEARCFRIEAIRYIEFKTALLSASFKLCGQTTDGSQAASMLIFNAVTDYLFWPILEKARRWGATSGEALQGSEQERFDHLARVNFKFMNFARRSLLEGEKILSSILQPEIRARTPAVFGRTFNKTISPTHMLILTGRELILIREESVRRRESKYGGIWTYVPLCKVASLSVGENPCGCLALAVRLEEDPGFELLFEPAAEKELQQFVERFREVTNS